MLIFLDESGDLGFDFTNKKPSNHFVITLLVCEDKTATDSFKTAVKRTLKNKLNHKKSKRKVQELHGCEMALNIRQYFYNQVSARNWKLYTVALSKKNVFDYLTNSQGKKKLYNFLANFLLEKLDLSCVNPAVTLVVDKCKNKAEIEDFNGYIANQLEAKLPLSVPLNIYHEDSKASYGLQAVDLFCYGVYRKYEHGDEEWYSSYAEQIEFETNYLGNNR